MAEYGLKLMFLIEAKDEGERLTHDFKMAVISADPATYIPVVFPEWEPKEEKVIVTEVSDVDLIQSDGEWVFNDDDVDLDAADALFQQTLSEMRGQHTMTERDLSKFTDDDW